MKLKVIIQLFVVLVLGFLLGFLTHSSIISKKIKNYNWRRGEVTFWSRSLDELNATKEQKDKIMPIVIEYSERGHQLMRENMRKVEPIWEEMEKEIAPHLTKEQLKIIEEIKRKRIERFRERTRGPGRGAESLKPEKDNPNKPLKP